MTRGILKLDVLANLEYFSCFGMFSLNIDIKEDYPVLLTIAGLFILSLVIQAFGGYGTVSQIKQNKFWHKFCMNSFYFLKI